MSSLWEAATFLPPAALGGGQDNRISEVSDFSDLRRALMNTSTSCGFFTVVNDTKMTLLRDVCTAGLALLRSKFQTP